MMNRSILLLCSILLLTCSWNVQARSGDDVRSYTKKEAFKTENIKYLMDRNFSYYMEKYRYDVEGDYYRAAYYRMNRASAWSAWDHSVLQVGILKAYEKSSDPRYLDALLWWADKAKWMINKEDRDVGNNHLAGEVYLGISKIDPSAANLVHFKNELDRTLVAKWEKPESWWWCDALFMAPPAFALMSQVTHDPKYIRFMDEKFRECYELLYDKKEKFFYRDGNFVLSLEKEDVSDKDKVFWGRGNGWVAGGICRILEYMPSDDPSYSFYAGLLKEMAGAFKRTQQQTGLWSPSLLDPVSFPDKETTGSSLICYALTWGVNHGILDSKEYTPVIEKAWTGLVNCMLPYGPIGYVQPIGHDPQRVEPRFTNDFGMGLFLLAASEILSFHKTK